MGRKPESILRDRIVRRLSKIPGSAWEKVEQVAIRGTADIVGCLHGCCYWIEVKTHFHPRVEKRERLQLYKLGKIIQAGGAGMVLTEENWRYHCQRLETRAERISQGRATRS